MQNGEEKHKSTIEPLHVTSGEMKNTYEVNGALIKTVSILCGKVEPQKKKKKRVKGKHLRLLQLPPCVQKI